MEGPLCDMLWADPMNEDDSHKLTDEEYQHFLDTDYIANQVTTKTKTAACGGILLYCCCVCFFHVCGW